jgi:serine/threonine-protein kinase
MKPGDVLDGKYELKKRLGVGASGSLWEGLNTRTERGVAVKLLPTRAREEDRQRLLREARAGGRIRHPNVVDVYDVAETADQSPFIVMELLVGETLEARLSRGPLSLGEALGILRDVAKGLAAAHKVGVVHRDLRPHNVFLHRLSDEGLTVKLVEFGISRIDTEATLTVKGITLGSPGYVAPEQIDGIEVDARADVWAFGALAYELLAGEPLFEGTTPAEILVQVTSAPMPVLPDIDPAVDADLRGLVDGCLVRDMEERRATIAECGAIVERALERLGAPGLEPLLSKRPRSPLDDDEPTTVNKNEPSLVPRAPLPSDGDDPVPTLHYRRPPTLEVIAARASRDTPTDTLVTKIDAVPPPLEESVSITEGTPIDANAELPKLPRVAWSGTEEETQPRDGKAPSASTEPEHEEEAHADAPLPRSEPPRASARPPSIAGGEGQSKRAVQMFQEALAPEHEAQAKSDGGGGRSWLRMVIVAAGLAAGAVVWMSRSSGTTKAPIQAQSAPPAADTTAEIVTTPTAPAAPTESAAAPSASVIASAGSSAAPSASASAKPTSKHPVAAPAPRPKPTSTVYNPSSL